MNRQGSETVRATGIVALLAIATIHFLQIVDTLEATPLLGVAYLLLIGSSIAIAAWLLVIDTPRAWLAAALLSAAVMLGYAFTRVIGTTFDPEDVGNWACALGLASLFVEAALVGISAYAITAGQPALQLEDAFATLPRPRDMRSAPRPPREARSEDSRADLLGRSSVDS